MKKDSISCSPFTNRSNIYLKITWKVIVTCVVKKNMIYKFGLNDVLHISATTHKHLLHGHKLYSKTHAWTITTTLCPLSDHVR